MSFEFSCHGCQKRSMGCHSSCEIYKEERARYDARKAEIDKKRSVDHAIYMQKAGGVARANRGKRGHKP